MRFARNIVNNNADNMRIERIHSVLNAFKTWAKRLKRRGWNSFITGISNVPYIENHQLEEERKKYIWLKDHPECADALHRIENHNFFFGRISYLLNYSEGKSSHLFNCSSAILEELFENDAPNENVSEKYRFQRTLLALSSSAYGYGRYIGSNWAFPDTKGEWKKYLEDFDHNIGFNKLMDLLNQTSSEVPIVDISSH